MHVSLCNRHHNIDLLEDMLLLHYLTGSAANPTFNTLVTLPLMYALLVWALGLSSANWQRIVRSLILMLSRMIHGNPSVLHLIVNAEFVVSPMVGRLSFRQSLSYRGLDTWTLTNFLAESSSLHRGLHYKTDILLGMR